MKALVIFNTLAILLLIGKWLTRNLYISTTRTHRGKKLIAIYLMKRTPHGGRSLFSIVLRDYAKTVEKERKEHGNKKSH